MPNSQPSLSRLLKLALPLTGAMLSQAIIGLVDTALVGHLGGLALASVSIGSYLVFILVALLTGYATGWQALVVKQHQGLASSVPLLNVGFLWGMVLAIGLLILGQTLLPIAIELFVQDDRINSLALHYSQWRLWGFPAIIISIGVRIYWSHIGNTWQYARLLLLAHIINAPLSYCLIYGYGGLPAMGAEGAGLGTAIALWLGALMQLIQVVGNIGTRSKKDAYPWPTIIMVKSFALAFQQLCRFCWAPIVQQLAFALHLMVFLWLLSRLGLSAMAASFSVLNVGLLLILPGLGLAQAAIAIVGKDFHGPYGKHWLKNVRAWSSLILTTGIVLVCAFALMVGLASDWLSQLLLINPDLQRLTASALPWYALAMVFETVIVIMSRCLVVTGRRTITLLLVATGQWAVFLPLMWWAAPVYGFMAVWWLHVAYRMVISVLLWRIWRNHLNITATQKKDV